MLLRVFSAEAVPLWNDEVLALAQALLDAGVPLSAEQLRAVVGAAELASRRGLWTASLKFTAAVFALVRKYPAQLRDGGHKPTLAATLGGLLHC